MRVLFGVGYFYPETYGGTEFYALELAKALQVQQIECAIIVPRTELASQDHTYEGIQVFRFGRASFSREEIIGTELPHNLAEFEKIVRAYQPDIFHLHSITTALGLTHLTRAKSLNVQVLFTAHVPGVTCIRGDLRYMSDAICDGRMVPARCTRCKLHQMGYQPLLSQAGALASRIDRWPLLGALLPPIVSLATKQKEIFLELFGLLEILVVVSQWQKDMIILNGLAGEKIEIIGQALPARVRHSKKNGVATAQSALSSDEKRAIKIGFLGRIDPPKGLHLLIDALLMHPDLANLAVEIVGEPSDLDQAYYEELRKRSAGDTRFTWHGKKLGPEKYNWLTGLDFLCVPSIFLETGPIVTLEALSSRVPVIGSNSGRMKELIQEGVNGLLFDPTDIRTLAGILQHISKNRLSKQAFDVRTDSILTTDHQAEQMVSIYQRLC